MLKTISLSTRTRTDLIEITEKIESAVVESKVRSGICQVFVPHTTAGIIVNENADPSVRQDITRLLAQIVPHAGDYSHGEGNSDAHIKSSLVGTDATLFIEGGKLKLGTWQGIFFCEFDGPRQRNVYVKVIED